MSALLKKAKLLQDVVKLENDIKALNAEIEYFDSMDPLEALTIHLHDHMCKYDHQDGCSWTYEIKSSPNNAKVKIHAWDKTAHKSWLKKCKPLHDHLVETRMPIDEYLQILLLTPID